MFQPDYTPNLHEVTLFIEQNLRNVRWHGDEATALCPFHDDHNPSFSINRRKGVWKCWAGCGSGGLKDLAERLGVDPPAFMMCKREQAPVRQDGITVAALAADKGLPESFLKNLGVKQVRSTVQITYLLEDGSPAPKQRIRTALRAKEGSRWTKGEGKPVPYGLWRLDEARQAGYLILTEGESDCWTLWYHGFPALGVPGADMTKTLNQEYLEGISKVYVFHEPDKGGDTFVAGVARRLAEWGSWQGQAFEIRLSAKDPNELHKQNPDGFKEAFQAALEAATPLKKTAPGGDRDQAGSEQQAALTAGLPDARLTDLGNAQRLVARHGQDLRYCHPWKKWLVWDGIRWKPDDTGEVMRRAKETVRSMYAETARIDDERGRRDSLKFLLKSENKDRLNAMVSLAASEPGIPVLPGDLDRDPWLLNVKNGTVDLRTGELRAHRREDLLTKLASVEYDPAAKCPRWLQFLNEIMDGNQNLIGFLQRAAGMSLTGDVSEHVLLICYGTGRNGKSTFLNTLLALTGDYGMAAAPDLLLARQGDRHPTELADLFGKRLVVAMETDEGRRLAEALVKQLTGGDPIKARRMREDFWQFTPTHKFWVATNHRPRVRGVDVAIWSRLKLVPFHVRFPDGDPRQDKRLPQKLLAELPGILAWAVSGCLTWRECGLGVPEEVRAATEAYRAEQDVLAAFINECCIINPLAKALAKDLYRTYVEWCEKNGERPMSQKFFGEQLSERGFERHRGTGGYYNWRGIGILADLEYSGKRKGEVIPLVKNDDNEPW